jgi:hypothetical protein
MADTSSAPPTSSNNDLLVLDVAAMVAPSVTGDGLQAIDDQMASAPPEQCLASSSGEMQPDGSAVVVAMVANPLAPAVPSIDPEKERLLVPGVVATVAPSGTGGSTQDLAPPQSREEFLNRVMCQVSALLPAPSRRVHRIEAQPTGFTSRRSQSLAGARVEFQTGEMERRATKKIMRSLDVIGEHDITNQQALEEYAMIPNGEALASLFARIA